MIFVSAVHNVARKALLPGLSVVLPLALLSCASGFKPTARLEDVIAKDNQSRKEVENINSRLLASMGSTPSLQDYILSEGDLIQVTVFEAPELNTTTRVAARGFVTLPLVGSVDVKGLTTRSAEQKIEDLYRAKYLQDPHVSVFVQEQQGSKVTVLGAVKSSGTLDYPARQRLMDVLAKAGGLTEKAGQIVQIRREGNDPKHPTTFIVDMVDLVEKGNADLNLEINGGDVIFVPEAGMVYVDGAVRKPGNYPIKDRMSIREAITAAGGITAYADKANIKLVRRNDDGKRDIVKVALRDMEGNQADSLQLKDKDVVFVEASTLQTLVYGLRLNVIGGLIGVGYTPPEIQQSQY